MTTPRTGRPPGRPTATGEPRDTTIPVRVSATERARIEALAERHGVSVSEWIRRRAQGADRYGWDADVSTGSRRRSDRDPP